MHASFVTAALLAFLAAKASAAPAPRPDSGLGSNPICTSSKTYTITNQSPFPAPPKQEAGETCTAGIAGCQIQATFEHSVAITVEVGASIGLDFKEIFQAGIDTSVSVTTENSESISVAESCPPGCECGLQSVAQMLRVTGTQTTTTKNDNGPDSECVGGGTTTAPYTADFPQTNPDAPPNNQLVTNYAACAVGTCNPISGGAPPPPCP